MFCVLAVPLLAILVVLMIEPLIDYTYTPAPNAVCRRNEQASLEGTFAACYISRTYSEARQRFLGAVAANGLDHTALAVNADDGLFIDVAVRRGDPSRLVLHISGTHGTEGYIGSAVQTALLIDSATASWRQAENPPTVVFVHALNPYGMAYWRRWNEDGVDLNRNALFSQAAWNEVLSRPANFTEYAEIDAMINPEEGPTTLSLLRAMPMMVFKFATRFVETKRALVAATYTRKGGLFYGGSALSKSHTLLRDFLVGQGFTTSVKRLTLIDVHSGLGPEGQDTLMVDAGATRAAKIFMASSRTPKAHAMEQMGGEQSNDPNAAVSGYEDTKGSVTDKTTYTGLFENLDPEHTIGVAQEFGTMPTFLNILQFIRENQAHRFSDPDSAEHMRFAAMTYNSFVPLHRETRANTVHRGVILFEQAFASI